MAEHIDDSNRRVVPRWRPFEISARLGHLGAVRVAREPRAPLPAPGEVEELLFDWRMNRTPIHASNLIDAALVLERPDIAEDAASFLLDEGGPSDISRVLARRILGAEQDSTIGEPPRLERGDRHRRIAEYRVQLHRDPRDPLRWVDLAREYSILGQNRPAERALRHALALAPEDRFVLRSASRFFLHLHEPDRAHAILRRAQSTSGDPWLLAAEIVAASAADRTSRLIRHGSKLLERRAFPAYHVSELASALGTLEHESANRKKVERLFDLALSDPTENSVAQAAWIQRHMRSFNFSEEKLRVPRAYEAQAWEYAKRDQFSEAVARARDWLNDEPFATRPAVFGSWVAGIGLGDLQVGLEITQTARHANPNDPRLLAQALYFHASLNQLPQAEQLLVELEKAIPNFPHLKSSEEWEVMLEADRGLIAYRKGFPSRGAEHYQRAISLAREYELPTYAANALMHYVREQMLANPSLNFDRSELYQTLIAYHPSIRHIYERFIDRIPQLVFP